MSNLEAICRICGKTKTDGLKNLFSAKLSAFLRNIEKITGMSFENESYLPQNICPQCRDDLRQAIAFRTHCIKTQHYFNTTLKPISETITIESLSASGKETTNKITIIVEAGDESTQQIIYDESQSYDLVETEDVIKEEADMIAAVTISEEMLDDLQKLFEKDCNEINDCEEQPEDEVVESERDDCETDMEVMDKQNHDFGNAESVIDAVTDQTEITIPERFKLSNRKPREKPYNKTLNYICDECGDYFNNTNHFITHINKHKGIKPYECDFCKKKFLTKSVMTSHRRIHTGERPFPCSYCGKRFRRSGMRLAHERVHTQERPYKCLHCTKAFNTKSALGEHMKVHRLDRLFSCSICNMDFSRMTNLSSHLRSKSHKQNVEKVEQSA